MNRPKSFLTVPLLVLLAALAFAIPQSAEAQSCGAGGPPCAANGDCGCPDTGAGNPVDLVTGNKYYGETDVAWSGARGLLFERHYNSLSAGGRAFGRGWTHGFETVLTRINAKAGRAPEIQVVEGTGRRIVFRSDAGGGDVRHERYRATPAGFGIVLEDRAAVEALLGGRDWRGTVWTWVKSTGERLQFDETGSLASVSSPDGSAFRLQYDSSGRLRQITDAHGRALLLEYHASSATSLPAFGGDGNVGGRRDRLASIRMPDGQRIRYEYDEHGTLARVGYPDRTIARYAYAEVNGAPRLVTVVDRRGRTRARYEYAADGRAIASIPHDGIDAVRLSYRLPTRADGIGETIVTNARGAKTVYRWRYTQAEGDARIVEAIGPGCAACATSNVRYGYDRHGRVVRIEVLAPPASAIESGPLVQVAARTPQSSELRPGPVLEAQTFEFDRHGRLASVHVEREGERRLVERRSYASDDPLALPIRIENPSVARDRFRVTEIAWNDRGQPLHLRERGFAPNPQPRGRGEYVEISRATTFSYYESADGKPALVGRLRAVDGPAPGPSDRVALSYDRDGRVVRVAYALGVAETFEYDELGRLARYVPENGVPLRMEYGASDRLYVATPRPVRTRVGELLHSFEYDVEGRVRAYASPAGQSLRLDRDAAGRLVTVTDGEGFRLDVERDAEGLPVAETRSFRRSGAAAASSTVRVAYDEYRRITTAMLHPREQLRFTYDARGVQTAVADHGFEPTRLAADDRGWLQQIGSAGDAPGGASLRLGLAVEAATSFDDARALSRVDSPDRDASPREHAGRRLVTRAAALTARNFDAALAPLGHPLAWFEGANRELTTYLYDDFGRVVRTGSNDSGWEVFTYASDENPTTICRANGTCDRLEYDALGRVVLRESKDAAGRRIATRFVYHGALLARVEHPVQTIAYRYDSQGRLVEQIERLPVGQYAHSWRFDAAGRLVERGVPDGSRIVVRYAERGVTPARLELVDALGRTRTLVSEIRQDPVRGLTRLVYGNGIAKELGHDAAARTESVSIFEQNGGGAGSILSALVPTASASARNVLWFAALKFDTRGDLAGIDGPEGESAAQHDPAGRLLAFGGPLGVSTHRYRYDAAGNLVAATSAAASQTFQYDPSSNRLHAISGRRVSSDASGNVTAIDGLRIEYGPDNRPSAVGTANGDQVRYVHNAFGERIHRTVAGAGGIVHDDDYFLYDGHRLVGEIDGKGRLIASYVYFGDEAIAKLDHAPVDSRWNWVPRIIRKWFDSPSPISFLHADHLGTPRLATDERRRVVWEASYSPYGAATVHAGSTLRLDLRLPGQIVDPVTGLHYNHQRDYAPHLGRYLQPDPIGLAGGLNVFQYGAASPLQAVDPDGESIISKVLSRGATRVVGRQVRQAIERHARPLINRIVERWRARGHDLRRDFDEAQEILDILGSASDFGVWDVVGLIPVLGDIVDGARTVSALCRVRALLRALDRKLIGFNRLPVSSGRWTSGRPGNGIFTLDNGQTVRFRDGFPDLNGYAHVDAAGRRARVRIDLTDDPAQDLRDAERRMRELNPGWRPPPNHVWHHDADCGLMILVPTAIHNTIEGGAAHSGGAALKRAGLC